MITLTDQAAAKVKELISAEGDTSLALRVAVKPGGCSGFQYDMFFDSDVSAQDQQADFNGVRVVVDAESAALLALMWLRQELQLIPTFASAARISPSSNALSKRTTSFPVASVMNSDGSNVM